MATPPRAAPPAIFAHLHSSPLVVRRRNGSEWRSLSSSGFRQTPGAAANAPSSGPTPPSLTPLGLEGINSSGLEPVDIIDVKQERKLLVQCLREAKKRIVWHTEVADLHTFRKVLSFGCRVLHFSGHGVPGKVIFENNKCEAQFISQQELKDLLLAGGMEKCRLPTMDPSKPLGGLERQSSAGVSSGGSDEEEFAASEIERGWLSLHPPPRVPVRLVFVSACHSESVAEAFVSAGVPHVVVVSKDDKVLDKKAMEFSKAFYTALFAGHSVQRAFEIGKVQADISTTCAAGNSKFKLVGHGNHHEMLFRDVPLGSFVENSLPPPVNECDAVAEVFVGRSLEIHQVYKSLVEGARLVTVTGDRGIGKTEVALQCAQYATERRVFKHIFFLRLELSEPSSEPTTPLIQRLAKSLGVTTAVSNEEELANAVRQLCVDGPFLLILDGCQRLTRRDASFRIILHHLLRRVSTLAILITSDSKIGAMDGVSEKIVPVEHLPPADAALLFTLRAPRRLKAHEMGGSTDLAAFAENPIIKSLMGHPRSICAVAQFLETKDMELDKHEFLNYIIPSVNAGLAVENCDDHTQCFPVLPQDCHIDTHPVHSHHHHHPHSHPHPHQDHTMLPHQQRWASMPSMPVFREASPSEKTLASLAEEFEVQLQFEDMPNNVRGSSMSTDTGHLSAPRPTLEPSRSENDLHMRRPPISKPLTEAELCVLNLSDSLKALVRMDLEGRLTWARAVVTGTGLPVDVSIGPSVLQRLVALRSIPMDWLAPQISRYFATRLKSDAVKRPLSVRSIDFLTKSELVWGGRSPCVLSGHVELDMFVHFWRWFHPLTDCVASSHLWPFTQPRLLHGFLSKGACVTMLQQAPPGTFLLRFSETRLRCFVIVYVSAQHSVQFVPVNWQEDDNTWYVALQGEQSGGGVAFPSIQNLILSVTVLRYLFPQTPKEVAFQVATS